MERRAIGLLNRHRLMTIATLRPDGWPQATMVGYVNDGLLIYFLISRSSQKFANIDRDQRVSLTVGRDYDEPGKIEGLSIAALASQVTDPDQRDKAYRLLVERHPAFAAFPRPDSREAVFMRGAPDDHAHRLQQGLRPFGHHHHRRSKYRRHAACAPGQLGAHAGRWSSRAAPGRALSASAGPLDDSRLIDLDVSPVRDRAPGDRAELVRRGASASSRILRLGQ